MCVELKMVNAFGRICRKGINANINRFVSYLIVFCFSISLPSLQRSDWQPKMPFITTPLNDLRQLGDVEFGPSSRSPLLGILGGALPKLTSDQHDLVAKAKKYAMEQSIRMVLMKQTLAHHQQVCNVLSLERNRNMFTEFDNKSFAQLATQRTQIQRQQALALMCR